MTISRIRTITVLVADQDRAKAFYTGTLGFQVRTDVVVGDNRWLEVAPADAGTAIVLHRPFPGLSPGTSQGVILDTDDLDADCTRLRRAGVDVDGPQALPWGRQATFSDPDGNGFVLSSPPPAPGS
jgi:catechol 2,3-dioxygenase-like lactoylglutathione lyase family enzyme